MLRLVHVDEDVDVPHLRTPAFRIIPEPANEAARQLAGQIGRRLLHVPSDALDTWWRAVDTIAGRDAELIALHAGLRRAIRATIARPDIAAAADRYRAAGLQVLVVDDAPHVLDCHDHATLCIARDLADARAVSDACRVNDDISLGRLLGYPDCCVEAFRVRNKDLPAEIGEFGGARAAFHPNAFARLNNLLFGERARYISFEPCSYACPSAAAVADAIAGAVTAIDPESVAFVDATLATTIAVRTDGVRARVVMDGQRITAAAPVIRFPGVPCGPEDHRFAAALVGSGVDHRGALTDDPMGVVVVPFREVARVGH